MGWISFDLQATNGRARAGTLHTSHGDVETPAFMPVGTQASVKTLTQDDLAQIGYRLVLSNTYHLFLRPGVDLIESAGGLHRFMAWDGALLTDSGGYQVMSLCEFRKLSDEGVLFQSHLDGTQHLLTPELATRVQGRYGVDISMALDECPPFPASKEQVAEAVRRTTHWASRCLEAASEGQSLFGIVQGGVHEDLRQKSLEEVTSLPFDGFAIGGVSVGEPTELQRPIVQDFAPLLPESKPRYLMGVGQPADILHAIHAGIDMFDCVLPTRGARHNVLYTAKGRFDITGLAFESEFGPPDPDCDCAVCSQYSAAYIRHLVRMKEPTGLRLLTYHNLAYYRRLVRQAREAIEGGRWETFLRDSLQNLGESG